MAATLNTSKLGLFIVAGLGILFAFYAGNYVADEDYTSIVTVLGILIVISIVFGLGKSIYILIPICWLLTGKISVLPLPFDVRELAIILCSVIYISSIIFKKKDYKVSYSNIDLWVWINLTYLIIGFIRNPVGIAAIGGSARVGGKPYVDVILALMAYLMMSRYNISANTLKKFPFIVLIISFTIALLTALSLSFPSVSGIMGKFYSDFSGGHQEGGVDLVAGQTRFVFTSVPGQLLILYTICRINPTHLLMPGNVRFLIGYLSGIILILLSGFRNGIIISVAGTFIAAIIRERVVGVAKCSFAVLVIGVSAILVSYTSINLPFTFQRTLCFLPGNWDPEATLDAKESSEWRFEMWRTALTSDKYINNKILGDGFGFLREDFERGVDMMYGRSKLNSNEEKQEMFLLDGDYHSGPVGSIRFVGIVGLFLFLQLLYLMFRMALKLIHKALRTELEFCTLFYCIPILLFPFIFIFIFGDFRKDLVATLFNIGMMKMIDRLLTSSKRA
jgi:hypothetical protein